MKKEYKKPISEVLEMEVQQMICQSRDFTQSLTQDPDGEEGGSVGLEWPEYKGEFD